MIYFNIPGHIHEILEPDLEICQLREPRHVLFILPKGRKIDVTSVEHPIAYEMLLVIH